MVGLGLDPEFGVVTDRMETGSSFVPTSMKGCQGLGRGTGKPCPIRLGNGVWEIGNQGR